MNITGMRQWHWVQSPVTVASETLDPAYGHIWVIYLSTNCCKLLVYSSVKNTVLPKNIKKNSMV
jgi:hypothetical protein